MTVEALAEKLAIAAEAEVVRLSHEVRKLEAQKKAIGALNATLREENANMGLRLAAQQLAHLQERFDLSERMKATEKDLNDLRNWIAGNVVQRDQEYENTKGSVSYLMGAHNP